MTALATYQALLDQPMSLRLRKFALRRLMSLETTLDGIQAQRLTIEGAMRHEPSRDGRGTPESRMSGAVTATTVQASARQRVRDSHDARVAEDRGSVRNYVSRDNPYGSEWAMRRDARPSAEGLPAAEACLTYRVPQWAVSLPHAERRKVATSPRVHSQPLTAADFRVERQTARQAISASVERHMRQRAIVERGTSDAQRHDFTQG